MCIVGVLVLTCITIATGGGVGGGPQYAVYAEVELDGFSSDSFSSDHQLVFRFAIAKQINANQTGLHIAASDISTTILPGSSGAHRLLGGGPSSDSALCSDGGRRLAGGGGAAKIACYTPVHVKVKILSISKADAQEIYTQFGVLQADAAVLTLEIGAAYTSLALGVTKPSGFHAVGFLKLVPPAVYVPSTPADEHHSVNIFRLGNALEPKHTLQAMFILIFVTIVIEHIFEHIHEKTEHTVYHEMFNKMTSELTILGIISFSIAMGINAGLIHHGVELIAFEFAHISIFFVAILYVVQSIFVILTNDWVIKRFHFFDTLGPEQILQMHAHQGLSWFCPRSLTSADALSYRQIRAFFITKHQHLFPPDQQPESFDFALYLKLMSEYEVVDMLNIEPKTWAVALVALGILYLYFSGPEWGGVDRWGHTLKVTLVIGYSVSFLALIFCVQSRAWLTQLVRASGHEIKYKKGKIDAESLWWWPSLLQHCSSLDHLVHTNKQSSTIQLEELHNKPECAEWQGEQLAGTPDGKQQFPPSAAALPQRRDQLEPMGDGTIGTMPAPKQEKTGAMPGETISSGPPMPGETISSGPPMPGETMSSGPPMPGVRRSAGPPMSMVTTHEEPLGEARASGPLLQAPSEETSPVFAPSSLALAAPPSPSQHPRGAWARGHARNTDAANKDTKKHRRISIEISTRGGPARAIVSPWLFRYGIACIEMFNTYYLTWFFAHAMMQSVDCDAGTPNEFCPEGRREYRAWIYCIIAPAPAVLCMLVLVPRLVQNYVLLLSATAFLAEHDSKQIVTFNKVIAYMRSQNKICARVVRELCAHGEDAKKIFSDIDQNGDGKLSYMEFAAGLGKQKLYLQHDEMMMVLRIIDTSTIKEISLDELTAFMNHDWEDHTLAFGNSLRRLDAYMKEGVPSLNKRDAKKKADHFKREVALALEWEAGDRVKVVKESSQKGKEGVIDDPDWNGHIKVLLDGVEGIRSYAPSELINITRGNPGQEAKPPPGRNKVAPAPSRD
jgi:hypothetical protein